MASFASDTSLRPTSFQIFDYRRVIQMFLESGAERGLKDRRFQLEIEGEAP
ncbi:MAG: hypothetical protein ACLTDS_07940 [Bianqueaceae bacterium]